MLRKSAFLMCLLLCFLLVSLAPLSASEPTTVGSWNVTFYLEPGHALGATQCVVFTLTGGIVGEPISGTWLSTTFVGWNGQWFQEGDRVQWYGFTDAGLATSEFGQLVHNNLMAGEFNHFLPPDGVTSSAGSWKVARTASCPAAASSAPFGADPAAK